jgi:EpsI family protein
MNRGLETATIGLLAAGVVYAFYAPLSAMVSQWAVSPMYSHGYTVPLISAWMVWAQRGVFARTPAQPARIAAAPVLAVALLMLGGGALTAVQVVQQVGFVLTVAGIVLFLFGWRYLVLAGPAIAYLLFMVPFWEAFTEPLHEPFQQNSASLGVAILELVRIPVHHEGTMITLPNVVLEVARECSGVNYLVAVMALALPLAWIRLRTWSRRLILILSSLAIAALANGLRVALIGVLAYLEVGSPLHGPFHVLHGLFVAGIGYVVLFAGLHFLEQEPDAAVEPGALSPVRWRAADAGGLAVVFWTIVFVGSAPASSPVALAKPLGLLSMNLGSWQADMSRGQRAPRVSAWNNADEHVQRRYSNATDTFATVDVWYFAAQRQGRELIGSGVDELHRRARPATLPLPDGASLTANRVVWTGPDEVGLFWYEIGGATEAGRYSTKLKTAWQAIRSRRSDAAAILITAPAARGDEARVFQRLDQLAAQIHGELAAHWPTNAQSPAPARGETTGD